MKKLFFVLVSVFLFNNIFAQYSSEYMQNNYEKCLNLDQDKMLNATDHLEKEKVVNVNCNYREKNWWKKNKTTLIAASISATIMSIFVGYIYYVNNYVPISKIKKVNGVMCGGPAPGDTTWR